MSAANGVLPIMFKRFCGLNQTTREIRQIFVLFVSVISECLTDMARKFRSTLTAIKEATPIKVTRYRYVEVVPVHDRVAGEGRH
jgi:hypothetical protein